MTPKHFYEKLIAEHRTEEWTIQKQEGIPVAEEENDMEIGGVKLKYGDYERFGWSETCRGCAAKRAKFAIRPNHTRVCRMKMIEKLGQTEDGKKNI